MVSVTLRVAPLAFETVMLVATRTPDHVPTAEWPVAGAIELPPHADADISTRTAQPRVNSDIRRLPNAWSWGTATRIAPAHSANTSMSAAQPYGRLSRRKK